MYLPEIGYLESKDNSDAQASHTGMNSSHHSQDDIAKVSAIRF